MNEDEVEVHLVLYQALRPHPHSIIIRVAVLLAKSLESAIFHFFAHISAIHRLPK